MKVHVLVPEGFEVTASGGNVYDRHLVGGLAARGVEVCVHRLGPDSATAVPPGPVVVDSLVASWGPTAFLGAVPLVHMLFEVPGEQELLRAAPVVLTTSRHLAQVLVGRGLPADRVVAAVPGVVPAPLAAGSATGGNLLCVATLTPGKGQDVLLEALVSITDLDWTLTMVGRSADAGFVDRLRTLVARAGIGDRVRLVGELTGADLAEAWQAADLLVLPSRAETYGMVVTEALGHGIPVLASAVGGVPEALGTVGERLPGMLVPPGDPAALARSLRRWLEEPGVRERLRRDARSGRPRLSTWSATAEVVATALATVVGTAVGTGVGTVPAGVP